MTGGRPRWARPLAALAVANALAAALALALPAAGAGAQAARSFVAWCALG